MGSPVFIFATTSLVAVILTAALISQYQRETTSIEDKYTNRSAAEIDATYHQSYLNPELIKSDSTYGDEIVGPNEVSGPAIDTSAGNNPDDIDNDGIPNADDPDPRNPDTDGDGSIDGRDPAPTDPATGTTAPPPPPPAAELVKLAGELKINKLYTNVRNLSRGATAWSTHTDAVPGDRLSFIIHLELINTSPSAEYEARLHNILQQPYLEYGGKASLTINQQNSQTLSGGSWMNNITFRVPPGNSQTVDIIFEATAAPSALSSVIVATNFTRVVTPHQDKNDIAFVTINTYPLN